MKEKKRVYNGMSKFDYVILSHGLMHNNADKCIYSKFTNDFGVIRGCILMTCLFLEQTSKV